METIFIGGSCGHISIQNEAAHVVGSNYWESEIARKGILWCSVNAGALRLLVPNSKYPYIAEMRTANEVIITYGERQVTGAMAYEFLFEDGSNAPFVFTTGKNSVDRPLTAANFGSDARPLLVYSAGPKLELTLNARFRTAPRLPFLKPWGWNGNSSQEVA